MFDANWVEGPCGLHSGGGGVRDAPPPCGRPYMLRMMCIGWGALICYISGCGCS